VPTATHDPDGGHAAEERYPNTYGLPGPGGKRNGPKNALAGNATPVDGPAGRDAASATPTNAMAASTAPTRLARTATPRARLQSRVRAGLAHVAPTRHARRWPTMSRMVPSERLRLLDRPINELTRRQCRSCDEPSRPQSARGTARRPPRSSVVPATYMPGSNGLADIDRDVAGALGSRYWVRVDASVAIAGGDTTAKDETEKRASAAGTLLLFHGEAGVGRIIGPDARRSVRCGYDAVGDGGDRIHTSGGVLLWGLFRARLGSLAARALAVLSTKPGRSCVESRR
jgi:hypothetical protein